MGADGLFADGAFLMMPTWIHATAVMKPVDSGMAHRPFAADGKAGRVMIRAIIRADKSWANCRGAN